MTNTEAIKYLEKDIKLHELFNETKHQEKAIEALEMAIEALEQEEIIRCRECKYCELNFIWVCKYRNKAVKPDGFCERGERK